MRRLNPLDFGVAWQAAKKMPNPPEAVLRYDNPSMRRLVALCYQLAFTMNDGVFVLGCQTAADLMGVSDGWTGELLRRLVRDGVLELVRKHQSRSGGASESSLFRYVRRAAARPGVAS